MKYKLEYVFINLFDNDFNFAMQDFAGCLVRAFERGNFTVEKCKDNLKEVFPRMMACLCHLDEYEVGKSEEMKRNEEYFTKQSMYLFDFEEIKKYLEENGSHWTTNTHLDRDVVRRVAPDDWLAGLDISLNAEAILIQLVAVSKSGKPARGKSSYRIF